MAQDAAAATDAAGTETALTAGLELANAQGNTEQATDQAGADTQATDQATDQATQDTADLGWLPESLRGNEALKGIKDAGELATKHLELLKQLEAAPTPPATPDGYQLNFPEGAPIDQQVATQFKDTAHKLGLSQAQVDGLIAWRVAEVNAFNSAFAAEVKAGEDALRTEWGADYEPNLKLAQKPVRRFGDPGLVEFLRSGAGNNVSLIRFLHAVAGAISEDVLEGDPGGAGPSKPLRTAGGEPMLHFPSMDK